MLTREKTVFVVVDIQGNLYQAMHNKETLLANNRKLIKGAAVLGLPVILTEQINIGSTIPEILELLPGITPIVKSSFSSCKEASFMEAIKALDVKQVILSGIEAHICVYQTAIDLIAMGFKVYLATDAIASRTAENKEIALRRLTLSGVVLSSVEMALFDLLKTATDPKAREIFKIVK
ncbi:MAG: putative hydrolase YcaC [Syntrophus sp. SKADARSKE-3]|nr:putative hydrolase YcaC [Syntrophus sp. SKADARSKE-3]